MRARGGSPASVEEACRAIRITVATRPDHDPHHQATKRRLLAEQAPAQYTLDGSTSATSRSPPLALAPCIQRRRTARRRRRRDRSRDGGAERPLRRGGGRPVSVRGPQPPLRQSAATGWGRWQCRGLGQCVVRCCDAACVQRFQRCGRDGQMTVCPSCAAVPAGRGTGSYKSPGRCRCGQTSLQVQRCARHLAEPPSSADSPLLPPWPSAATALTSRTR